MRQFLTIARQVWERYFVPFQVAGWAMVAAISVSTALALTAPPRMDIFAAAARIPKARAEELPSAAHVGMPKEVRGFYMTSYSAASPKKRAELFAYAKRNALNAVVIDIKDFGGALAFSPIQPSLTFMAPKHPTIPDIDAVLKEAHAAGLYVIARQFIFQDPLYANTHPDQAVLDKNTGKVWADFKGVSWVDPSAKADWKYNASVAREAYARGFDEIQLDYIRFPSDGALSSMGYALWDGKTPKQQVIGDFYRYMHDELVQKGIPVSLDLFGYVTWYRDFDLGIGQLLANGLPNATAISAMVYPSHYSPGSGGFANPAEHPYDIVNVSLAKAGTFYGAIKKGCAAGASEYLVSGSGTAKIAVPCGVPLAGERPWLQAFDLGAVYTKDLINAQIKAARDNGASGWLLWNARNVYRDIE